MSQIRIFRCPAYSLALLAISLAVPLCSASGIEVWSSGGGTNFASPTDVKFDGSGNMYVVDAGNSRVVEFDRNGLYLREFGNIGVTGRLSGPIFEAVDPNGRVDVVSSHDGLVRYYHDGVFTDEWGGTFSGTTPFVSAVGIVEAGQNGKYYVTDASLGTVEEFDYYGNYIATHHIPGAGIGLPAGPTAIAINDYNQFVVADTANSRIDYFDANWSYLRSIGSYGVGAGQFHRAAALAFDNVGRLYVSDSYNNRIEIFDPSGSYVGQITNAGSHGNFYINSGLAFNSDGELFVADTQNNRVVKLSALTNVPEPSMLLPCSLVCISLTALVSTARRGRL